MNTFNKQHAYEIPSTQWSCIRTLRQPYCPEYADALTKFFQRYSPAMKNGLRRSLSLDDSTTDDIWQEFMVLLMNKPDTFSLADSERGKFRVYFFVLLRNFAISRLRTRHHFQSLDYVIDRTSENGIPSEILDIEWAATVWLVALTSMYDSCLKAQHLNLWYIFRYRLLALISASEEVWPYSRIVKVFRFPTEKAAANLLPTAKRKFRTIIREIVAEYCQDEIEIDQEIRDLVRIASKHSDKVLNVSVLVLK